MDAAAARRPPHAAFLALAFVVPVLLYLPSLRYGFVFDDTALVVNNPAIRDPARVADFFRRDLDALWRSAETVSSNYYRPLFLIALTVGRALAGTEPAGWHAIVVVMHGLASLLAMLALRAHGLGARAACAGAILFALHPVHVSSVAWVSGLQDVLVGVAGLLAYVLYRRWAPAEGGRHGAWAWLAAAALAYAGALLCKEVAVGLAGFVAVDWLFRLVVRRDREGAVAAGSALAVLGVVTALYLGVRVAVLGTLFHPFATAPPLPQAVATVPVVLASYARYLLAPFGLFMLSPVRPVASASSGAALAALAACAVLASGVVLLVRRWSAAWFPCVWLAAWLLPCLNLRALNPEWIVVDRYLYLPSLAVGWLLVTIPGSARGRRLVVAAAGLVFAVSSLAAMRHFRDERTFWDRAVAADPGSSIAWAEQARLAGERGDTAAAREALLRAIALDPASLLPRLRLANLLLASGEASAAARSFEEIVARNPGYVPAWRNLPLALSRAGDERGALARAAEAAARFPRDPDVLTTWAVLLRRDGQVEAALAAVRRARQAVPDDRRLALREAVLLSELGRRDEALALAERLRGVETEPALRRQLDALIETLRPRS